MFTGFTVALLLGAGGGGWIYSKMDRKTGHNQMTTWIVTLFSAFVIIVILTIILDTVFGHVHTHNQF